MKIKANGIDIEVEDSGPARAGEPERAVLLLIHGLGMQLIAWPQLMVQQLVDAGYRVIRFDNRDIGLSQHFDHLRVPNLMWTATRLRLGFPVLPPYSLSDMAQDTLGVLDALGVRRAHVLGVSMGGMIAQRLALAAPERLLSLTSVMSSSGARHLPLPSSDVMRVVMQRAPANREAQIEQTVHVVQAIAGKTYPVPEAVIRERAARAIDRSHHPNGMLRQLVAVGCDSARARALPRITVPTLVVHGNQDGMVPLPGGQDTAKRIPGARFVMIDGMGHDLPDPVVPLVLNAVLPHLQAHQAHTPY